MQREPQPVKLYTQATMYRYAAPQKGRYREHWQQSVEAIGSDDPAVDAEVIQLYTEVLRRLGVTQWELQLNSIGDANCRPAYVERLEGVAGRARATRSTTTRGRSARRARSASSTSRTRRPRARSRTRRRSASRSATSAASTSRRSGATSTPTACRYGSSRRSSRARLLHAHDVRVRRPRGGRAVDDLRRRPLRRPDRGDRRPADAGDRLRRRGRAPGARARERRGSPPSRRRSTCSSWSTPTPTARPRSRRWRSCAPRASRATPTTPGRSLKGQRTQLARSGAQGFVHVARDGATIKRGDDERDVPVDAGRGYGARMNEWRDLGCGEISAEHVGRAR